MPPCPRCATNPAAHNFFELGKLGETDVLYCAPAKAIESKETSESFSYFVSHLEAVQGKPWIFLVDCKGMKLRHTYSLSLTKQIMRVMNEDHESTLQKVILLNPNTWTRAFLTIIQPFLRKTFSKKLKMLQTEMDLFLELSAYGSATAVIGALRNQEILGTLQEENEEE